MLTWISDHRCRIGGTEVALSDFVDRSTNELWMEKPRATVEALATLLGEFDSARILEIGINRGGSTVLINEVARPAKLVAVDIEPEVPPACTPHRRRSS
jgi:predicted O-methyltransferase YrrM